MIASCLSAGASLDSRSLAVHEHKFTRVSGRPVPSAASSICLSVVR